MAKLKDQRKPKKEEAKKKWKGGRPEMDEQNRCSYLYAFRLNEEDNIKFEKLLKQSGATNKTEFITNCIFQRPFQVVITDKSALDVCIKLSEIHSQIRLVGVNYNQVTKAIRTAFTEKAALSFLYKLEKSTIDLVGHLKKVIEITTQYKEKWLPK